LTLPVTQPDKDSFLALGGWQSPFLSSLPSIKAFPGGREQAQLHPSFIKQAHFLEIITTFLKFR
jgi:hypothetical protein